MDSFIHITHLLYVFVYDVNILGRLVWKAKEGCEFHMFLASLAFHTLGNAHVRLLTPGSKARPLRM